MEQQIGRPGPFRRIGRTGRIVAAALPPGSIVAAKNAVAIKRYDREDGEYWMPAEGYPLPLSNQQMQFRIDTDNYSVLRVGSDEED